MVLFSNGFTAAEIARYFDCSPSLISQRLGQMKAYMVKRVLDGASGRVLEVEFGLPVEVIAEHIRAYALSQSEWGQDDSDLDLASDLVGHIEPPKTTRNERRKAIEQSAIFGAEPVRAKKPKRAGTQILYTDCIGCSSRFEADDMFMVNTALLPGVRVCQNCMEEAILPLFNRYMADSLDDTQGGE